MSLSLDAFAVDIVPIGGGKAELRHAGRTIRTVRSNGFAEVAAGVEERRLREERARVRKCLCCGVGIRSEGPHHRMCADCRREA